jgi:hypothetical protein
MTFYSPTSLEGVTHHTPVVNIANLSNAIRHVARQTLQRYAAGMEGNMLDGVEHDNC